MKFPGKALLWVMWPLLLLTLPLLWQGQRLAKQLANTERNHTRQTLELHAGAVQQSFNRIEDKLDGLAAFVAGQLEGGRQIDVKQFDTFANGLHASSKWIRAFQIVSNGIITHTCPLQGNEAILGYNLLMDSRPVIGSDVLRAQRTGRSTITGPIDLIQGGLGIIIRKPLAHTNAAPVRMAAIILNIAPLLAESDISGDGINDVQLAIRRESGEVFYGSPAVFAQQPVTHRILLPDGSWEMAACPLKGWQAGLSLPVLLFYGGGVTVIFLLCALFFARAHSEVNLAATVRDRTEALRNELAARQQAEEQLRQNYSLLKAVTEGTSDAIFVKDLRGCYQMINSAGARFLGESPETIIGKNDRQLFTADTAAAIMAADRNIIESERTQTFEEQGTAAGVARIYQASKTPWHDAKGNIIGVIGISRDITANKQAEEQVRRLHEDLQRYAGELELRVLVRTTELAVARDRAEAADRIKSAFLATMSHELRTPLNSIIGFTGILLQGLAGPMNPEQAKQLGMVQNSVRHLLALINDVLDISKIEACQIEIAPEPFDLREAIENVLHLVAPLADKKQLPLVTQVGPEVGQIVSDRRRVKQILLNLLSNAIKFTQHGTVTLRAESADGLVCFAVVDTGMGIKPEDMDKLFLPFRQLDSGLTRQHEGTGLGLVICKRLVERLGGVITVESQWGIGSTFQFTLPVNFESERKS